MNMFSIVLCRTYSRSSTNSGYRGGFYVSYYYPNRIGSRNSSNLIDYYIFERLRMRDDMDVVLSRGGGDVTDLANVMDLANQLDYLAALHRSLTRLGTARDRGLASILYRCPRLSLSLS